MSFRVHFTEEALDDLERLYAFQLRPSDGDWRQAEAALESIRRGLAMLESSPFACRRAPAAGPLVRELMIGFGSAGFVLLFEIEAGDHVTAMAIRHQREADYR